MTDDTVREQVRRRYAAAAVAVSTASAEDQATDAVDRCCGSGDAEVDEAFGSGLYAADQVEGLPAGALAASLGCGNPLAVADLRPGETVLDLGSGGGIDVLLSARRVGPQGRAYGLDMTEEMLALARENAAKAGARNVDFLKGQIEAIPLPAATVDVVISNCVINLSTDKPAVLAEMFRVLRPGGRIGISDVVAEDEVTPEQRAERGSYVGCIAGALSRGEYLAGLAAAGFAGATVEFTHEAVPGLHGAIIRATKPQDAAGLSLSAAGPDAESCCGSAPGRQLRMPLREPGRWRPLFAELVGTALLVAIVVGSGIAAERLAPGQPALQLLANSLATAAGLAVLILLFAPASGAHLNPLVTAGPGPVGPDAGPARRRVRGGPVPRRAGRFDPGQHHVRPGAGAAVGPGPAHRRAPAG